ncbi:regulator of nonsense transcripts UPF3-like isoform X1 [Zingiber officinale]|uniref:regulator of nonsense transcripts UPF3-like isoform X1 n=1 Tax=Zingiber officinale TaxID=94328 RepID=UPI001C4D9DA7|nr:regulator of nonsense transcripts UPF3-like isoform X1 [Zingiber officinale]XP_042419832.1 regulator of nonsense transcripts UPF3-like isoform X1 [Zingiber officinale]
MKDLFGRTKVSVRRLPPSMVQAALVDQIDSKFAGRYDWFCFRSGKNSQKDQRHSRAYINFKRPEDVVEFAEFFDGHIFVNEKGVQFKVLVEYAPSQRVPKPWLKKDGCEGTILKDLEYMEFLELISKPVERLPSAEIQLERKEAERAGATKEVPIVTPLMDFVRRKRAAKHGVQRLSGSSKVRKRTPGVSSSSSRPSAKRGSEKRRVATSTVVLRDGMKKRASKDKPTYLLMSRKEDNQSAVGKSISVLSTMEKETQEIEFDPGVVGSENDRLVLLKVKEKESSDASKVLSSHQIVTSSVRSSPISTSRKNHASGKIIRSILRKEGRMDQSYISTTHTEQLKDMAKVEYKHPPRSPSADLNSKDLTHYSFSFTSFSDGDDNKYTDDVSVIDNKHGSVSISKKHDRRTRNKEMPDHGVWAPLHHPVRSQSNDGIPSSSEDAQGLANSFKSFFSQRASRKIEEIAIQNACIGQSNNLAFYETSLGHGERKTNVSSARSEGMKVHGGGRVDYSSAENGSHRHAGHRGSVCRQKDVITSLNLSKGKSSKRGSTVYSSHERQVWVQKSGFGS